jgi:glutathione S-transferase
VILYATPLSSFALRVRLVLALKGLAAEVRPPPDGYRSAAFRAIFPTGQAPVLVDGDLTLGEADVIAQYLDERAPDPPLMPADPAGRARVRLLCRYHDLHLDPPLRPLFPAGAAEGDARAVLAERLAIFAGLARPGPFLHGDRPTLADLACLGTLVLAPRLLPGLAIPPRLADLPGRVAALPAAGPVMAAHAAAADAWLAARAAAHAAAQSPPARKDA